MRRIYALKKARRQVSEPFVDLNSATLRGAGAMSALSGHVKGEPAQSRARKQSTHGADRLRKYLTRFGLGWEAVSGRDTPEAA